MPVLWFGFPFQTSHEQKGYSFKVAYCATLKIVAGCPENLYKHLKLGMSHGQNFS